MILTLLYPLCVVFMVFVLCLHLERVGDHNSDEPHCGAETPGCSCGPPAMESAGCVNNSEVPIYTDTGTGWWGCGGCVKKGFLTLYVEE